mmetsp:Transcript_49421/g.78194  ORF Transcript_49421/g.78194 Transcript_49421/m.78194 type:complete len:173 (-) Transcript_49421:379-897(-)
MGQLACCCVDESRAGTVEVNDEDDQKPKVPAYALQQVSALEEYQADVENTKANPPNALVEKPVPQPDLEPEVQNDTKKNANEDLPSVEIVFNDQNGAIHKASFTRTPLGMAFKNTMPLTVSKIVPKSMAEEVQVQKGWKFVSIGGDTLENLPFKQAVALLRRKSDMLPKTQD